MLEELDKLFQRAKLILSDAEQRHRSVYDSALDISDFTEAQRVSAEAQRSILQIREWKHRLDAFSAEVAASDILTQGIPSPLQDDSQKKALEKNSIHSRETPGNSVISETDQTGASIKPEPAVQIAPPVEDAEEIQPDPPPAEIDAAESDAAEKHPIIPAADGKPRLMKLLGRTYRVSCWKDVYLGICELMLLYKPYVIAGLDRDTELSPDKRVRFSYVESNIAGRRKRLSNGLWIDTDESEDDCVRLSYGILEKCGYAAESLMLEFMEE